MQNPSDILGTQVEMALRRREDGQALERSERELADFFETASIGLHWVGPDGIILRVNQAELDMLGYTREEYVGRHIAEFHADQPVIEDILARLTRGERLTDYAARLRRKDGQIRYVLINSSVLFENGEFIHTRCFTHDITEQKRAEQALRESQAEIAAELADSRLLQQVSSALIAEDNVQAIYEKIIDAAMAIMRSDYASMQMLYPERGSAGSGSARSGGELRLLAFRGFNSQAASFWQWVRADSQSTCGEALRTRQRAIAANVEQCQYLAGSEDLATYLQTGIRACQTTPLLSRDGTLVGMISTHWNKPHGPTERDLRLLDILARQAADLIERNKAEEALRESEERFRLAQSVSQVGTFEWNIQSGLNIWTPELEAMYGLKPGEFQHTQVAWESMVHADDRAGAIEKVDQAIRSGEPVESEWRVVWPDGTVRWVAGRFQCFKDAQGKPLRLAGVNIDITHRKESEQATARLAAIVSSSEDAIISKDLNGIITSWNRGAERLFGYSTEEVTGKPATLLIPEDHLDEEPEILERIRRGEPIESYETVRRRKDGSLLNISLTVSPLCDEAGRVIGASKVARDITARVRLAKRTREQAAELLDLHRRKDEFLAMLSHELRNPLAPIANAVQLLRLEKDPSPIQEQARTIIERQLGQLTRLIEDLMEVSRMSTGRIHLNEERLDLRGVVGRAVETVRPLIAQRRHAISIALGDAPIWLLGDAGRLEQVVVNLLTNAAKYTDEAGHLWLGLEQVGEEAVLRVRDTGVGIAPDLLPRIFDLFTQGERALDRAQGGLGVGLALVRQIVQMHRGRVEASSVVGQGSEFAVHLPVVPAPTCSARPGPVIPAEANNGRCRVLVVDDNVDCLYSMQALLTRVGHEVLTASDGPSALEAARTFTPQVVLLDIGIPRLDGYEVAKGIRAEQNLRGVLLVATTGYGLEVDRQRSRDAGIDHHLVKPLDFRKVQELLATAERRSKAN